MKAQAQAAPAPARRVGPLMSNVRAPVRHGANAKKTVTPSAHRVFDPDDLADHRADAARTYGATFTVPVTAELQLPKKSKSLSGTAIALKTWSPVGCGGIATVALAVQTPEAAVPTLKANVMSPCEVASVDDIVESTRCMMTGTVKLALAGFNVPVKVASMLNEIELLALGLGVTTSTLVTFISPFMLPRVAGAEGVGSWANGVSARATSPPPPQEQRSKELTKIRADLMYQILSDRALFASFASAFLLRQAMRCNPSSQRTATGGC